VIERGYFTRALHIVAGDPILYIVGGAILLLLSILSFGLLAGPAIGGLVWVTLKRCRGEEVTLGDLFKGFESFANNLVAGITLLLMVVAGLCLFIVPGIVLGALFCFTFAFIADRGLPLPEAMAASRRIPGSEDLLDRCLFFLVLLIVGFSGAALLVVGLLFTWPLMWATVAVAYEDMAAPAGPPPTSG